MKEMHKLAVSVIVFKLYLASHFSREKQSKSESSITF